MRVDPQRKPLSGNPTVGQITCPLCQGNLLRQRRRTVDRLRSLLSPVKRYRCDNFACQWEGNVSNRRAGVRATGMADNAPVPGHADRQADRVPAAFVVHMVLVAVGVAFVFVVSTLEPASWIGGDEQAIGSSFYEPAFERSVDRTASRSPAACSAPFILSTISASSPIC